MRTAHLLGRNSPLQCFFLPPSNMLGLRPWHPKCSEYMHGGGPGTTWVSMIFLPLSHLALLVLSLHLSPFVTHSFKTNAIAFVLSQ